LVCAILKRANIFAHDGRGVARDSIDEGLRRRPMKLGIRTARFAVITAAGVVLLSFLYLTAIRKNTSSSHKNTTAPPRGSNGDTPRWEEAYAQLPMGFEENRGQAARDVRFVSHGSGYALSLAPQEIDIALLRHGAMIASPLHRAAALRALRPRSLRRNRCPESRTTSSGTIARNG
jgi:hypothetical protein